MAGGALIVMAAIVTSESSPAGFAAVIPAVLFGLVLFLCGLTFADLRRYCWRMRCLGQKLSGAAHSHDRFSSGIPILMAIALAFTGFGLLVLTAKERGTGGLLFFLFDLMVLGVGVAFLLLGLRVDELSGAWSSMGGRVAHVTCVRAGAPAPSVLVATVMPIGVVVWGLVTVCAFVAGVGGYWEAEAAAFFGILLGLALSILAMTCLLNRIETVARHSEQMAVTLGVSAADTSRFVPAGRFPLPFYAVLGLSTASWICSLTIIDEGSEGVLAVAVAAAPCLLVHLLAFMSAQMLRISRNLEAAARAVADGETVHATGRPAETTDEHR